MMRDFENYSVEFADLGHRGQQVEEHKESS